MTRRTAVIAIIIGITLLLNAAGLALFLMNSGSWQVDPEEHIANVFFKVAGLGLPLTGGLIALRRPGNQVGWGLLLVAFLLVLATFSDDYAGRAIDTGGLPAADWAALTRVCIPALGLGWIPAFLLIFPSGQVPSGLRRFVLIVGILASAGLALCTGFRVGTYGAGHAQIIVNPFGIEVLTPYASTLQSACIGLISLSIVASFGSLLVRFFTTKGDEHQQIKWVLFALAILVPTYALTVIAPRNTEVWAWIAFALALNGLAGAMAIAIIKHRLYDIDRIITGALGYTILTASFLVTYTIVVAGTQRVLAPVSGGNDVAVALTALAVAAIALPARRLIQTTIDQKFHRRTYDAARAIEQFASKLRQQSSLDDIEGDLSHLLRQTMEPSRMILWVRKPR